MSEKLGGHTVLGYDSELSQLHGRLDEMGQLVLNQLELALEALKTKDTVLARKVMLRDNEVDHLEKVADGEIFKILARRCPVASDLRMVMAASKIIDNLERIGDEASKIAVFALHLYSGEGNEPNQNLLRDVFAMGHKAAGMLRQAMEGVARIDDSPAEQIIVDHRELDREFQASLRRLITYVMEDSRTIGNSIGAVLMMKAIERIGDHAQNITEYMTFQIEGEDVRHSVPDFSQDLIDPDSNGSGI